MLAVNIVNISLKRNDQTSIILSDVNFITQSGERSVILGRNGGGKTTLLKAISLLLDEKFRIEGEINYNGENVLEYKDNKATDYRKNFAGIIFQDPFSSLNPLKKLGYYHRFVDNKEKLIYWLTRLGFAEAESHEKFMPYEISGGMAQKFQLALNFSLGKDIYLLDEPTSALDTISIGKLQEVLIELSSQGKKIVIVTQDKLFAKKISTKIIKID